MPRNIRPTSPQEASQIAALLADMGLHPGISLAEMHWKYWQDRADWPGPRSFVMTRGAEIVAHAAIVPGTCVWRRGRVRAIHVVDWAARPHAVGAGVVLMKHVLRLADIQLAIGGSEHTRAILPGLGFRPCGEAIGYVRPLHPQRILSNAQGPKWKLLPRVARGSIWSVLAPSVARAGGHSWRVGADEVDSLASCLPIADDATAIMERPQSLLNHVMSCPTTPVKLYAWGRSDHPLGYFLLAFAPGQVRLVDCWIHSSDPGDWRSLVLCAVAEARRCPDAAELVTWASDPMLAGALRDSGFHMRDRQLILMLARKGISLDGSRVRVQMLDNDAACLHHGRAELWA